MKFNIYVLADVNIPLIQYRYVFSLEYSMMFHLSDVYALCL